MSKSLRTVQERLKQNGVRDVKFSFVPEMKAMALSDAKEMVAGVLLTYMNLGDDKVHFMGIGDSRKPNKTK